MIVGRVAGLFGTRGWLRVESFTRPHDNLLTYTPWLVGDAQAPRSFTVTDSRRHHGRLIVHLEGVDERDTGVALLREWIRVERAALEPPEKGQFLWVDLLDCAVRDRQGRELGRVTQLFETGANDVLEVTDSVGVVRLIPFVQRHFIDDVDIEGGLIRVDWLDAPERG